MGEREVNRIHTRWKLITKRLRDREWQLEFETREKV